MAEIQVTARWLETVGGWKPVWRWLTAFGLGAVADLGMAPFFIFPAYILAMAGLLFLICATGSLPRPARAAAATGWWFGFGFFFAGLFWIGEAFLVQAETYAWMLPFAVTLLPAGLAIFFSLACWIWTLLGRRGIGGALLFAALLFTAEWLRGNILSGFPWNLAAHIWGGSLASMQGAALLGTYGLSFVTILMAALWGACLTAQSRREMLIAAMAASVLMLAPAAYGSLRLTGLDENVVAATRIRIVQPAIDQKSKWNPDKQAEIFRTYLDQTRGGSGKASDQGVTHVVWPESALPFHLDRADEARNIIKDALGSATLITGQQRARENPAGAYDYFNSVLVMTGGQIVLPYYDKIQLVPFGEFLPLRPVLSAIGLRQLTHIRSDFARGSERIVMKPAGAPPMLPLICYEILYPGTVSAQAGWIVNVTNDAWFGKTTGPYQHLTAVRFKAVETGLPVIRSANTGISAAIAPTGRIIDSLGLGQRGIIDVNLPDKVVLPSITPYRDAILLILYMVNVVTGLILPKTRQNPG